MLSDFSLKCAELRPFGDGEVLLRGVSRSLAPHQRLQRIAAGSGGRSVLFGDLAVGTATGVARHFESLLSGIAEYRDVGKYRAVVGERPRGEVERILGSQRRRRLQ